MLVVAGCAAPAATGTLGPTSTPLPSATPLSTPAETVFTSPLYGYSITITDQWRLVPATVTWDGKVPLGHDDATVDQLITPQLTGRCEHLFACGPIAWALSTPTNDSLATVVANMNAAEARDHDCPNPETKERVEIDGEAALLTSMHCPAGAPDGGLLIMRAITIHNGTAYDFWMQDPANEKALEPSVRADFKSLIASVDLP